MMVDATINPLSRHRGRKSQFSQHRKPIRVLWLKRVSERRLFEKRQHPGTFVVF
ncbi:hypothetical protein ACU81Q_01070 [Komagataeibacter melomenusus]